MFEFKQLSIPVVQAPMAGGVCTPELVAAVANAGGVGSFGFAYSTPERISADLTAAKQLTDGPVNANFFVFRPVELPSPEIQREAVQALKNLPIEADYSIHVPEKNFFPVLEEQIEPIWQHRPAVVTFHFAIPPASIIEKAHALGIAVGITATNVAEARAIEQAGADFVVAQGIEAGGHRGTFEPNAAEDENLTAIELTKQIAAHCRIPIVTAGAIMDGADIGRALNAGAVAAQLGTAFLCCNESGASAAHKDFLLNQTHRASTLTKAFSGRLARGIENDFMRLMAHQRTLPFPIQNTLTGPLRQWAAKTNCGEYRSLWAGTAFARTRRMAARELMATLQKELAASQAQDV